MGKVCLLIQDSPVIENGNYLHIGQSLLGQAHQVTCCPVDTLRLHASRVVASGFELTPDIRAGDALPTTSTLALETLDLIWIFGLGERSSFLDKVQLLHALQEKPDGRSSSRLSGKVRIINSLNAIMHLKSKYLLAGNVGQWRSPMTWASPDADELLRIINQEGGEWIVKPPAGSLGRDVFLVNADDRNARVILQYLCGKDNHNYTLLQRHVPEIVNGEKRVLLAANTVIGQYLRHPGLDHRTNVSQGARIEPCSLTREERDYCMQLAMFLGEAGAHYAAVDIVFPWLLDVNVINPGGLTTLYELTGEDHSAAIGKMVVSRCLHE